jgi:hypothetical protein
MSQHQTGVLPAINLLDDLPARTNDEEFTELLARQGMRIERSSQLVSLRRPIDLTVRVMTNGCYSLPAWPGFASRAKMSATSAPATMC